jgi:hypothetical protein
MKRPAALLLATILHSCGGLPALRPVQAGHRAALVEQCVAAFPTGEWQATHLVEAQLPMGQEGSFLGVVAVAEGGKGFRSVLLSPEGFVLVDASYREGRTTAHRAVPPLDAPGFARGMTSDLRLLLFAPEGMVSEVGVLESGWPACRWRRDTGKTVEVQPGTPGAYRVRLYDRDGQLERDAQLSEVAEQGFARQMRLIAPGPGGYSLQMRLLEVQLQQPADD